MTEHRSLSWLPNALTLARCGLAGFVGWLIYSAPPGSYWPFAAFILVAATDFIDGYAARRLDAVSAFGAFLDPVADKMLVGISLIALTVKYDATLVLLIPTAAIIVRDVIATLLRLMPSVEMPVSTLAKWKTAAEMTGIGGLLLAMGLGSKQIWTASLVIVWGAALLAVYTLGLYIGALIADSKRPR